MAKRVSLKGIELNRTVGIEIEGYSKDARNIINKGVRHSSLKRDASLGNSYGWDVDYNRAVGLEVVSKPLSQLDLFDDIFEDIKSHKWNVGRGRAGTHIHVDAIDFTVEDKVKMAFFMEKLDEVMFLMVKPYRRSKGGGRNAYCRPLDTGWKKLLDKFKEHSISGYNDITRAIHAMVQREYQATDRLIRTPNFNRYNFINIFNTSTGRTIEFRLFHSIRDSKDAKKFSMIAYSLVELVKNSTVEQLEFIASQINESDSSEKMVENLAYAIGLEFVPKIFNNTLATRINERKSREKNVVAV